MDHIQQGNQKKQFTRDDCARIIAEAINVVFEKLSIQHVVEGIAVFPAGKGDYLVDIVMRDLNEKLDEKGIWTLSITIPPSKVSTLL